MSAALTPIFANPLHTGTYSARLAIMNPMVSPARSPTESPQCAKRFAIALYSR